MLSSPTWYYKNQAIVWQGPCGELDLALNNLSRRGVGILTQSIELASYQKTKSDDHFNVISFFLFLFAPDRSSSIKRREDARHLDMHASGESFCFSCNTQLLLYSNMGLAVTHKINRKYVRDSAHGYIIIHYMDDDDVGGGVERLPIQKVISLRTLACHAHLKGPVRGHQKHKAFIPVDETISFVVHGATVDHSSTPRNIIMRTS